METKFDKPPEVSHGRKFAGMTRPQKVVFFAFPNVQND